MFQYGLHSNVMLHNTDTLDSHSLDYLVNK